MKKAILSSLAAVPMLLSSVQAANAAPSIAQAYRTIDSNFVCRQRARNKFFQLSATNMVNANENFQFATVGDMSVVVWCRSDHVIVTVAGPSGQAAADLRDDVVSVY